MNYVQMIFGSLDSLKAKIMENLEGQRAALDELIKEKGGQAGFPPEALAELTELKETWQEMLANPKLLTGETFVVIAGVLGKAPEELLGQEKLEEFLSNPDHLAAVLEDARQVEYTVLGDTQNESPDPLKAKRFLVCRLLEQLGME